MIETAIEQDGPQILELTVAAGVFKPIELACVEELWNAYLRQGEASGYVFLVYREGQRVVGYACFGPHPLTEGTFDLYWIVVDPVRRRGGIGHALLERVEAEVRMRSGRLLLVETSSTSAYASARRFFEACGYRYEAVVHSFYVPGDDLIIFVKEVIPTSGSQEHLQLLEDPVSGRIGERFKKRYGICFFAHLARNSGPRPSDSLTELQT